MARRWTKDEHKALTTCMNGRRNYKDLSEMLNRSVWAVECQVIKAAEEQGKSGRDYNISQGKIDKYNSLLKHEAASAKVKLDEKLLNMRALAALLDFEDIRKDIREIKLKLEQPPARNAQVRRKLPRIPVYSEIIPAGVSTRDGGRMRRPSGMLPPVDVFRDKIELSFDLDDDDLKLMCEIFRECSGA